MNEELLKILCCPETGQHLKEVKAELIEELNVKIQSGALKKKDGSTVEEQLESALIRKDGLFIYPIRQNIPVMLAGEAILLPKD